MINSTIYHHLSDFVTHLHDLVDIVVELSLHHGRHNLNFNSGIVLSHFAAALWLHLGSVFLFVVQPSTLEGVICAF